MPTKLKSYSFWSCIIITLIFTATALNCGRWKTCTLIQWDQSGYNLYLTGLIINNDLKHHYYYDQIDISYSPTQSIKRYGLNKHPATGHEIIKYPCGVAIFQLPLFLIAHYYCKWSGDHPDEGYSIPYQLAMTFSTILFSLLGLLFLRAFLLSYFKERTVTIVLLAIGFGTNFYYYGAYEQGMSHNYLFFLYAALLYYFGKWFEFPNHKMAIIIGLLTGLTILTRPTDVTILLIVFLWVGWKDLWPFCIKNYKYILSFGIVMGLVTSIQLVYWKYLTGQWVYYSYTYEKFEFLNPHIYKGLFSYRKGWFVYTPLALVGFLGFLYSMKESHWKFYVKPVFILLLLNIYIVFSWKAWFYGGSFGCRAMLQSLALLAFPLASLIEFVNNRMKLVYKSALLFTIIVCVVLNIFQSYQYHLTLIHYDKMNKEYYWKVFGKLHISDEDRQLLNQ